MASPSEIRGRLKELLEGAIEGLKVEPYPTESAPSVLPAVVVGDASATLEEGDARLGLDSWEISLRVLVSAADLPLALARLDTFLARTGPNSIRAVLADHRELGFRDGTDAELRSLDGYGPTTAATDIHLAGATFHLVVRTPG